MPDGFQPASRLIRVALGPLIAALRWMADSFRPDCPPPQPPLSSARRRFCAAGGAALWLMGGVVYLAVNRFSTQQDRDTLLDLLGGPLVAGSVTIVLLACVALAIREWAAACNDRSGIKILVGSFLLFLGITVTGYVALVLLALLPSVLDRLQGG